MSKSLSELLLGWELLYNLRFANFGTTTTIVPLVDPGIARINTTSSNTKVSNASGSDQVVTHSVAPTGMATAFAFRPAAATWAEARLHGPAGIPVLKFDGTAERMTIPDVVYWTPALVAISWVVCVYGGGTGSTLMAKQTTGGIEWDIGLGGNDRPIVRLYDEDDAVTPNGRLETYADAAISASLWHHLVFTYDGTANASGLDIYVDGAIVASTDTDQAGFTSVRDYTAVVEMGAADNAAFYNSYVAVGPFGFTCVKAQLTVAQIKRDSDLFFASLGRR